jgi:hypothetical protein
MVAGTIEDEQWTSRMSSSSSDARLRTRNESRETRVNRIVITRTPTVWRMRVIPHTLRHYVASRTILGKFGFGPFFGHISRFTGYIVLTPSIPPVWGHEP